MSRQSNDVCNETSLNNFTNARVNNMDFFDSFFGEKSEQGMLGTSSDHVTSNQFQNNILCKIENDSYPFDQENDVPYEIKGETDEQFTKNEDLCVACGHVSAYEFFSFPINADIRKQWAKFCDINLDEIKPHFRLCDGHFKPEDYQISMKRRVLMPTCAPTLRLKVKQEARTDQRSVKDELVQSAEHIKAEDVYTTNSNMPSLEISIDNPQIKIEVKSEPFTEEVMLDEPAEKVAEDNHFVISTISPREISTDLLHNAKANLKQFSIRLDADTSRNVTENNRYPLTTSSAENLNSRRCSTEVTPLEREYSDEDSQSPNYAIPSSTKSLESRYNAEAQPGYSKDQENADQGRITRSTKQKKHLPTVKRPTRNSGNISNSNKVTAEMRDSSKPFHCQVCNKQFAYKRSLDAHGLVHSEEKRYKCSTCDARFNYKNSKLAHERMHGEEHCFECDVCGKKYSYKESLFTHLKLHSTPFSCQICSKSFARKDHLRQHQRMHSEEKCYKCRICDARYKHNRHKVRHERTHGGACFECADCGKKFSCKDNLTKHVIVHFGVKPFSCQKCGKKFTRKGSLTQHQQTHTKEKPFKCRICNQQFSHQKEKARHERFHVEGPRFECVHCGRKFCYKKSLANHISSKCI